MPDRKSRSSTYPTPVPEFDVDAFAKKADSRTLATPSRRPLDALLAEIEGGWDETEPTSGTFNLREAVLQSTLDAVTVPLGHRERFVLMHVDGVSTFAQILAMLEMVGVPSRDGSTILHDLLDRGLVVVRKHRAITRPNRAAG
jgi:hypothetical protein